MPPGHRQRQAVRQRPRVPVGERRDREDEPRDPREPHAPASRQRRRALGPRRSALGSHPKRAGWLRRLHRRSMGKRAHRRTRGRAFSEDNEAVAGCRGSGRRVCSCRLRSHGNRRLRRVPLHRLRVRSGRPSCASTVPDVWRHVLGEPSNAPSGLRRARRPHRRAGILSRGDDSARPEGRAAWGRLARGARACRDRCGGVGERRRGVADSGRSRADRVGGRRRARPRARRQWDAARSRGRCSTAGARGRVVRDGAAGVRAPGSAARRPRPGSGRGAPARRARRRHPAFADAGPGGRLRRLGRALRIR